MKIGFLTSDVFTLGGVQRVLSVLGSEISKIYEVDIICTSSCVNVDRSIYNLSENVNIVKANYGKKSNKKNKLSSARRGLIRYINNKTGIFNNKNNLKLITEAYYPKHMQDYWIKFINEHNYDLVIGVEGYYSLLIGIINDRVSCRSLGWQHSSYDSYLRDSTGLHFNQDILFEKYINKLDGNIVLNEYDKKMYKTNHNINSQVIYNPKSFNSSKKSKLTNKTFLAAGRFVDEKGFDLLIEAFKLFSVENEDWKLNLIGDGPNKESIIKAIKSHGLENRIEVLEFTNDIKSYFLKSSILLLPSRREGMPMIVLEALEMGVPTIAFNISGVLPLISNGSEGLIVDKYDINEFANAMKYLSQSYEDRVNMSNKIKNKSRLFDIDNICNQWIEFIEEIVK